MKSIEHLQSGVQSLRVDLLQVQRLALNTLRLVTDISVKLSASLGDEIVMDSLRIYSEMLVLSDMINGTQTTPSTGSGETPVSEQVKPSTYIPDSSIVLVPSTLMKKV